MHNQIDDSSRETIAQILGVRHDIEVLVSEVKQKKGTSSLAVYTLVAYHLNVLDGYLYGVLEAEPEWGVDHILDSLDGINDSKLWEEDIEAAVSELDQTSREEFEAELALGTLAL